MSGVEWWVPWALVLCAFTFAAGVVILVTLAARGVWRLFHPLGAHAGGVVAERLWPLVPERGSMILAEERALVPLPPLDWREQTAHDLDPATLAQEVMPCDAPGQHDLVSSGLGVEMSSLAPPSPDPVPEPEGHTITGRPIETSGEWLRRLERNAAPGWTFAGVAA